VTSSGWFEAMRIPLLQGRPIQETDTPDKAPVVVINKTLARKYWPAGTRWGNGSACEPTRAGGRWPAWSETCASSGSTPR